MKCFQKLFTVEKKSYILNISHKQKTYKTTLFELIQENTGYIQKQLLEQTELKDKYNRDTFISLVNKVNSNLDYYFFMKND